VAAPGGVLVTTRLKLKPGQKGTKNLLAKYGDALLCVRYRYDVQSRTRSKTVELIVERKPWTPPAHRFKDDTHVPVRIGYDDTALRDQGCARKLGSEDTGMAYPVRENQRYRIGKAYNITNPSEQVRFVIL